MTGLKKSPPAPGSFTFQRSELSQPPPHSVWSQRTLRAVLPLVLATGFVFLPMRSAQSHPDNNNQSQIGSGRNSRTKNSVTTDSKTKSTATASNPAENGVATGSRPKKPVDARLAAIKLPPGFQISYFAKDLLCPRQMTISPAGTVFVGTRIEKNGCIYAIVDKDKDGVADKVYTLAGNLDSPNGVAFRDGSLYVAEISRLLRYDDIDKNLEHPPQPVTVSSSFPKDKHHGWKYIRFGPDNKLYVPVGAPCNVCVKDKDIYASIMRINADGSGLELFAGGVRNTVGFDWDPINGDLWFTDNGRDLLGDEIPPDELNHAPHKGLHFGFPYRYGMNVPDPEYGPKAPATLTFTAPAMPLGPHVAALGMRFYRGAMFPQQYKHRVFIAEHGSWNRTKKIGYRISTVQVNDGHTKSYEPFATGWLQDETQEVRGRPVDLLEMADGAILVSDDHAGVIYRISYVKP
jgi:glucose/arabinose dehydrogenase